MPPMINACFMCKSINSCAVVDDKIVGQVEYLLPEITIVRSGIPLRICSMCEKKLHAFSKFKRACAAQCIRGSAALACGVADSASELHRELNSDNSDMEIDSPSPEINPHSVQDITSKHQELMDQNVNNAEFYENVMKHYSK